MFALQTITGAALGPQLFIRTEPPSSARFQPIEVSTLERPISKPRGGMWTSTLTTTHGRVGSAWIEWCQSEWPAWLADPERRKWWRLEPDPTAQLVEIDDMSDLKALLAVHRRNRYADISGAEGKLLQSTSHAWEIDFPGVRNGGSAGIHLTEKGQWRTRFGIPFWLSLYGWDCETTLWLRWAFVGKPIDVTPTQTEHLAADLIERAEGDEG